MAIACSIEAGQLAPEDKKKYDKIVRGRGGSSVQATRFAAVGTMLKQAKAERKQLIAETQRVHPDLINARGEFFEDLEAQAFDNELQSDMFTKTDEGGTAKVRAALSRKSRKDPEVVEATDKKAKQVKAAEKINATQKETKSKDGGTESGSTGVPPKKQSSGAGTTPSRSSTLKKGDKSKASDKGEKGKRLRTGKRKQDKPKTPGTKEDKQGVALVVVEQKPAVRKEQQPTALEVVSTARAADFADSGQYDVALSDGRTVQIYRDVDQFTHPVWHLVENDPLGGLGTTMEEALDALLVLPAKQLPAIKEELTAAEKKVAAKLNREELDVEQQEADAKLTLPEQMAEYKDRLTRFTGKRWNDAAAAIMDIALLGPVEKVKVVKGKETNVARTAAYEDAKDMVFGRGPDQELLWGGAHYADATAVLEQLIVDEVRSKTDGRKNDPTFNDHKTLWGVANLYNLAPSVLRTITMPKTKAGAIFPTSPPSWIQAAMPATYNWKKHGVVVTDAEVMQIIEETQPATAEEMSNHEEAYESSDFELEGDFDDVYEDILDDYGPGRGKIFDTNNNEIKKPMSVGNAKLLVKTFMSKIFNKSINATVYKNVAEMKRKDPKLYAEATASRSDKKPIPDNAAGYATGKRVYIFSDNIATKQQLNFTLSHEVIGHFGLGSIMPTENFNKLLDDVYARDGHIRRAADLMIEVRGMDKREATEEALADAAAIMDNSLIVRIADAIKRFFNKLGMNFTTDMTRYFLHHSRRYQRTGQTPDSSPYAVMQEFKLMEGIAGRASHEAFTTTFSGVEGGTSYGLSTWVQKMFERLGEKGGALKVAKSGVKYAGQVVEKLQSMDNLALRSNPLMKLFQIFRMQKERLEALKTRLGEITEWSNRSEFGDKAAKLVGRTPKEPAPTKAEKVIASIVLPLWNRVAHDRATSSDLSNSIDLAERQDKNDPESPWVRNEAGWEDSRKKGHMTIEQLNKGVYVQKIDPASGPMVERDDKDNVVYFDDNGKVTTEVDAKGRSVGKPKKIMEHIPLMHKGEKIKVTKNVYRLMEAQREAIDTIAEAVYLDKLNGVEADTAAEFKSIMKRNKGLRNTDEAVLRKVSVLYKTLYNEGSNLEGSGMNWKTPSINRANAFLHNVMRILDSEYGNAKVKDWVDGPTENVDINSMEDFLGESDWAKTKKGKSFNKTMQPLLAEMIALSKVDRGNKKIGSANIVKSVKNIYLLDTQVINSELYAKNTIQTAYIPLRRTGKYQVRVQAFEVVDGEITNTPVVLDPIVQSQLYYTRMDKSTDAEAKVTELNSTMETLDNTTVLAQDGSTVNVAFRANWGVGVQGSSMASSISYDDLASVLVRAGVDLKPADREKLVQLTASEHSTARSNLQKDWTPGWNPNVLHGIAEHLERQSHIAAKNRHQHAVARLMMDSDTNNDWEGNTVELAGLQNDFLKKHRAGTNQAAIDIAFKKMAQFQWQHVSSAPTAETPNIRWVNQDGTDELVLGKGKSGQYIEAAKAIIDGYHKYQGTPVTGDEAFAEQGSWAMSGTAILQLGGSLAPALVNMTALTTHSIPYLATMNTKTGYGGGHGLTAAGAAIFKAGSDLSLFKDGFTDMTGSGKRIEDLITSGNWKKYFESIDEAEMLHDLTVQGALTPNLFNALSDVARSGDADSMVNKISDKWMLMFSKSEQYNRRVTALAAYRLDKARLLEANGGKELTKKDIVTLRQRATDAVNFSQGNYDSFNRPAWAQGNVFKYLWMYKQFQVITVQLIRNLAPGERAMMIGFLIMLSGIKGVPFGDDLMDLVDTLMQKFDIKSPGVEAELSLLLGDGPIPSALVARGAIDYFLGFTGSTRFSMGDLIPGTGMFKAGQGRFGKEVESMFGPVWGAWKGVLTSGATAAQYAAETVGLKDDVTSLGDVLRTGGGFTAFKNYARGFTYMSDGAITNNRGQVVAKDAGFWDVFAQMVGFYPAKATDQYAVIRMTNDARDYAQSIKRGYVEASLKAKPGKERRAISRMVKEWNKDARGTPFFIKDFEASVNKSRIAAKLSSSGRNLKSIPTAMKPFGKELLTSRGFDPKGIPTED